MLSYLSQQSRTTFSPGAHGTRSICTNTADCLLFRDFAVFPRAFCGASASLFLFCRQIFLEVFCIGTTKEVSINEEIRATEIRVVDADGSQLGVMKTQDARKLAYEKGLDLVEIAPGAEPPVCRIMDFGKYRFEKEKKKKEAKKKQQKVDIKEVQLSYRIDTHDFETKVNHARRFLEAGNKVKVSVRFRGREMNHTEIGLDVIKRLGDACADIGTVEKPAALDGRQMLMFLAPKNAAAKSAAKPKKEKSPKVESADNE